MVTLTVRKIIIGSRNAAVWGMRYGTWAIQRLTNEYQESSLGSKSGWYVGLTTLLPSCWQAELLGAQRVSVLAWGGGGQLGSTVRTLQNLVLSVRTASFHTKIYAICLHTTAYSWTADPEHGGTTISRNYWTYSASDIA